MDDMKKQYGLLGEKLGHSISPFIHTRLAEESNNRNYFYFLIECGSDEVGGIIRDGGFDGLNVTVPYKGEALRYCDVLSPEAKKTGSVNTVVRGTDGSLYGGNTDYSGFAYLLKKYGIYASDKKCIILGSGGSSKTAAAGLSEAGAREVVTVSRNGENNYGNIGRHFDAQIIINATPVGMYPDTGLSPVDLYEFDHCETAVDLIYNPYNTKFLRAARNKRIFAVNGLSMLCAQARDAYGIFTGIRVGDDILEKIYRECFFKFCNIVIVGMPGCGKSSIGKALAGKLGLPFYDTDDMVEAAEGKTPAEIITRYGEDVFRNAEEKACKEAAAGRGRVISTGGGILLREANRETLAENGLVIHIDRKPELLVTNGRPLSENAGISKLYGERITLYRAASDITVRHDGEFGDISTAETADVITEAIEKYLENGSGGNLS